jgi:hypothetical protein
VAFALDVTTVSAEDAVVLAAVEEVIDALSGVSDSDFAVVLSSKDGRSAVGVVVVGGGEVDEAAGCPGVDETVAACGRVGRYV